MKIDECRVGEDASYVAYILGFKPFSGALFKSFFESLFNFGPMNHKLVHTEFVILLRCFFVGRFFTLI